MGGRPVDPQRTLNAAPFYQSRARKEAVGAHQQGTISLEREPLPRPGTTGACRVPCLHAPAASVGWHGQAKRGHAEGPLHGAPSILLIQINPIDCAPRRTTANSHSAGTGRPPSSHRPRPPRRSARGRSLHENAPRRNRASSRSAHTGNRPSSPPSLRQQSVRFHVSVPYVQSSCRY